MKTLEEIRKIREEKRKELNIRVDTSVGGREKHILVCHGTGCTSSKSTQVIENFKRIVKEKNLECTCNSNRMFWVMCQRTNSNH